MALRCRQLALSRLKNCLSMWDSTTLSQCSIQQRYNAPLMPQIRCTMRISTAAYCGKRVLGAIAHINSGKTTTSEAMLFTAGALRRMGNVDVGDTALDYLPAERERGITINAAAICFKWREHEFFLVDSPGHLDFTYEVERALKVMDGVIVLLDAVSGVQPQTETVWRQADSNSLSRIVFVNKMDRDGADFDKTVSTMRSYFNTTPVVIHVPIFGEESRKFCGIYDLTEYFNDRPDASGLRIKNVNGEDIIGSFADLSSHQQSIVAKAADSLVEALSDFSDDIMALWLEGNAVSHALIVDTIRCVCVEGRAVPVLCGSSLKGIGVEQLMDSVVDYLPSPLERSPVKALTSGGKDLVLTPSETAPFLAYAFKVTHDKHRGRMVHLRAFSGCLNGIRKPFWNTTKGKGETPSKLVRVLADKFVDIDHIATGDIFAAVGFKHTETGDTVVLQHDPKSSHVVLSGVNTPPAVFSVALEVDSSAHEKALEDSLQKLVEEDCSLEVKFDDGTGEMLLSGMGELHLEVAVDRMSRSLPFSIHVSPPRVAYRETVTGSCSHIEHYDATIGSNRLRASLTVSIDMLDSEMDYSNEVHLDDAFSAEEADAIRDGVHAALGRGPLLGSPLTKVRVRVERSVDTRQEAVALRACASRAVRNAVKRSGVMLLEPVMSVECVVPEICAGDVIAEIAHPTRRRGIIESVEADARGGGMNRIKARIPLQGVIGWATRLRSITKGRGELVMEFHSYEKVDMNAQDRIVREAEGR